MRPFTCASCGQLLFFENSVCLHCHSPLGVDPDSRRLMALTDRGDGFTPFEQPEPYFRRCSNELLARCNWLVAADDPEGLCTSCRLTTERPNDDDTVGLAAFADAETAKRRLLAQIGGIGLTFVPRSIDPDAGLAFEFLSARNRRIITGHQDRVITLDLSESDDAHREFVRQQLGEPYRTVLGHLRHEIGHYFWPGLIESGGRIDAFRSLFGDERTSYEDAKKKHYGGDSQAHWQDTFVSEYATMHPWEDWAETFAHYLHIEDGLHTARSFGLAVGEPSTRSDRPASTLAIEPMVDAWLALTVALNGMSRSIGEADMYPFVLAPAVIEKLDFVRTAVVESAITEA